MAMYYLVEQNGEHFYVDAGGRRVPEENLKGDFTSVNYDADLASSKVKTITQSGKFGYQTLDGQPLVDCVLDYDIKTAQGFVDAMSSLKAKYIQLIQQHPENKAKLRQELEQEVKNLHGARLKIIAHMQKLEREATAEKETAKTPSNTTETVSPAKTNNATTSTATTPVTTTESSSQTKTPLGNGITMLRDTQGHYGYEDKDGNIFIPCDLPIDVSAPSKTYNASVTKLFEECKVKLNLCTPSEKQALINEYKQLSERIQTARQAYNSKVKELKTSNSTSTATAETATAKTAEPSTTDTNKVAETKASTSETNNTTGKFGITIVTDSNSKRLHVKDENGKIVKDYRFMSFSPEENVYVVEGKHIFDYGVLNAEGKEIVPCGKYVKIGLSFSEGLVWVVSRDDYHIKFINKDGNVVIDSDYTDASNFSEGFAAVKKDGKWGFIDKDGKKIGEFEYDGVQPFHDGLALVSKDGAKGFIDKDGKKLGEIEYDETYTHSFTNGLACVKKKNGEFGVIDTNGNPVIDFGKYEYIGDFDREYTKAKGKDGKYGIINRSGDPIVKFEYDSLHICGENLVEVFKDGKYGFIDIHGNVIVDINCITSNILTRGLVYFRSKEKQGLVNDDGVVSYYDQVIDRMSDDFVSVKKDGKWGYVNKKGELLKGGYIYDKTEDFYYERAIVNINGKWGLINNDGDIIIGCDYDGIHQIISGNFVYAEKDGKFGIFDRDGIEIVKCTLTEEEADEAIAKLKEGTFNPEDYKQETVGANSKRNTGITGDDKSLTDGDEGVTSDGEDVTDCDDGVTGDGGITV